MCLSFFKRKKPIKKPIEKVTKIILYVPYEKVQGKDWCLPASGAMIFRYYDEHIAQLQIANRVIIGGSASSFRLVSYAKELGFYSEWKRMAISDIEEHLRQGNPLIVVQRYSLLIKNAHCRVITGFDSVKAELTLHDSAGKNNYKISYKEFFALGFDTSEMLQIILIKR